MTQKKVFLGSSTRAKKQAILLADALREDSIKVIPWWSTFRPGRTLLQELDRIKDRVDMALLIFTPDVSAVVRKNSVFLPNQNVLFEFAFFYSALGPAKVAMVKYGDVFLPGDLGGYIYVYGSKEFVPKSPSPVLPRTRREYRRWIRTAEA